MLRNGVRAILAVMPCLALLLGLVIDRPILQSQAASTRSHHFGSISQITCGQWNRIPSASKNSANSALEGVVGISVNDAWAVGFIDISSNPTNRQPFTMHWNGTHWRSVPSPNQTGMFNELHGVAAISTSDVWAVGEGTGGNGYSQALIEHWDGTSWSVVLGPSVGIGSVLYSVVNIPGTNQLWAVGGYSSNNSNYALIDYWDGTQWNALPSPPVNSNNSGLQSVTAFSPTDAWAVGEFSIAGVSQTLIEHWDGTSWSVVPSPNASSSLNGLFSVTPVPNTDQLWAVGTYDYVGNKFDQTLIEYWDGSAWNIVPSANSSKSNLLLGTAAIATNNVWSVGFHGANSLIEHWDGVQWSVISQPASTLSHSSLWSISVVPNQTDIWAVGFFFLV